MERTFITETAFRPIVPSQPAARRVRPSRVTFAVLVAAAICLGFVAYAAADSGSPGATVNGCYNKTNGALRILQSTQNCSDSEMPISWNQAGAQGPAGAQGVPGPAGEQGPQGPAGTNGLSVTSTALAAGDPNCAFGGSSFTAASGVSYACNGAPGAVGPTGPQGPPGPAGGAATTTVTQGGLDYASIVDSGGIDVAGYCANNGPVYLRVRGDGGTTLDDSGVVYAANAGGFAGSAQIGASLIGPFSDKAHVDFDGVIRNEYTGAFMHLTVHGTFGNPCSFEYVTTPSS